MFFYNTLFRKKEKFEPFNPSKVGLYSCGPTVYDYAHIGHARTYVFVDVLKRVLEYSGYKVDHVMNITDVGHLTSEADTGDDKVEKKAKIEGKTAWDIAKYYTKDFFDMTGKLNILKPQVICKATDYIPQMIKIIKQLEEKGLTYVISDGVYFDTSKLKNYGKLARLKIEDLKEGARVGKNKEKRNPTDFALWKFTQSGTKRQMEWQSPWGVGFPGWHIECSAMSMEHLGETIDIHTGGIDHIPIHHTNEIAQSEGATGKLFVKYWLHAGHLLVEGKKMSKSLGNYYRLKDVVDKGYDPLSLRYLFLTAHYRTEMNFTWKALEGAQKAFSKLKVQLATGNLQLTNKKEKRVDSKLDSQVEEYSKRFRNYLNDDLDMPRAIALVWEVVKSDIPDSDKYKLIIDWDRVFGFGLAGQEIRNKELVISQKVKGLVKEREKLREEKKWEEADKIRKEIEEKGYLVEDKQEKSIIKKKPRYDL